MSALVIQTLDGVLGLIGADPRRWAQGVWRGVRENGAPVAVSSLATATCFCLGGAISEALNKLPTPIGPVTWTELRSDVERELLVTLEAETGERFVAVYIYNDRRATSHADVVRLVTHTRLRLRLERVAAWAKEDARAGAGFRKLPDELRDLDDHYQDEYTRALVNEQSLDLN